MGEKGGGGVLVFDLVNGSEHADCRNVFEGESSFNLTRRAITVKTKENSESFISGNKSPRLFRGKCTFSFSPQLTLPALPLPFFYFPFSSYLSPSFWFPLHWQSSKHSQGKIFAKEKKISFFIT